MHEDNAQEKPPGTPQHQPDLVFLIKGIQQQLTFLEKKVDMLLSQAQAAPVKERHFSRPPRHFDRPRPHGKGHFDARSGERGPERGNDFDKRHDGEDRGFAPRKKFYGRPHEGSHGSDSRGFAQKKKPFYQRDKRG